MADKFEANIAVLDSPAENAAAVTPNDSVDLPNFSRALYVGTAGNIALVTAGGDSVTLTNVPVGFAPLRVARVLSTGTTASGIVALW